MGSICIVNLEATHYSALEQLHRDCFPTLAESELMRQEHFHSHFRIFPEGDFVALDGDMVVGLGSGFFINFDFDDPGHSFLEIIANGYYTNHDPEGEWYYGGDISVHPDYRGRRIGRMLYDARKGLVRKYDRKGIVAGGLLPGFAGYKQSISVQEYVRAVEAGKIFDRTLSFQLRNGFEVRGLLENYIEDSASNNWSTLIVWENR
jgi:GNAT superfamily N-acetyltransferase